MVIPGLLRQTGDEFEVGTLMIKIYKVNLGIRHRAPALRCGILRCKFFKIGRIYKFSGIGRGHAGAKIVETHEDDICQMIMIASCFRIVYTEIRQR